MAASSEVVDAADPTFKPVVNVCRDDPILRELTYNGQPHGMHRRARPSRGRSGAGR